MGQRVIRPNHLPLLPPSPSREASRGEGKPSPGNSFSVGCEKTWIIEAGARVRVTPRSKSGVPSSSAAAYRIFSVAESQSTRLPVR